MSKWPKQMSLTDAVDEEYARVNILVQNYFTDFDKLILIMKYFYVKCLLKGNEQKNGSSVIFPDEPNKIQYDI
jgi:hypothetical protein